MEIKLSKKYRRTTGQSVDEDHLFRLIDLALQARGVPRDAYRLGADPHLGFGELRLERDGDYWIVCVEERGEAFSPCIFTTYFDAVNYFLFRLTGVGGGDLWKQL
jgi:hypothetical protein